MMMKKCKATPGYFQSRIARDHSAWIEAHPEGTLGQLKERIETALEQCQDIASADDPPIHAYDDVPEPLASELPQWGEWDEERTFSYREANLEEHVQDLEIVTKELGPEFRVADLSVPELCDAR